MSTELTQLLRAAMRKAADRTRPEPEDAGLSTESGIPSDDDQHL